MRYFKHKIILFTLVLPLLVQSQTFVIPDPNFRTCLSKVSPAVLNANNELIISQAQATTGILECTDYNITNVIGFEYFDNITEVLFNVNLIGQVKTLPANSVMTRLVFDDNQLTVLPDLSKLTSLRTFAIRRNKFTSMPDISASKRINRLYLKGNAIKTLPNLSIFKELLKFDVSSNLLTTLPNLDSLPLLEDLVINNNQLETLPSLTRQIALIELDASENRLSKLPVFAPNNVLTKLDIENNLFTELPNFAVFPKLKIAYLDNNHLTFSDLIPLTKIAGYDTLFPLNSQKPVQVGKEIAVIEKEVAYLTTGVDLGVSDVVRTWFLNGRQIQKSTSDSLRVLSDSVAQSGYYYCVFTNAAFPNLTIRTDSFRVNISKPCDFSNSFVVTVSQQLCDIGGSIKASTSTSLPSVFSYRLVAADGQEFASTNGTFENLSSKKYTLYGQSSSCKKIINPDIFVAEEKCETDYFTPDGDGQNDTYSFTDAGMVSITDKFGNKIKTLSIPEKWDGTGKNGKVTPGLYFANINNGEKILKITVVY